MHPNEALLRREYDAFARRDIDALREIFAEDVVYHVPGANPFSGDHRGREAIFRLFAEDRRASFTSEIHDVLANNLHAVALTRVRGERDGRTLDDITVQRGSHRRREDHGSLVLPRESGGERRVLGQMIIWPRAGIQPAHLL